MIYSNLALARLWSLLLRCGLIWCTLSAIVGCVHGIRSKRSSFLGEDSAIHTEYVDKNNRTIWAMFNLTEPEINRILSVNGDKNKDTGSQPFDSQYFNNVKEYRLNDIKNRLESAFQVSNSEESQEHPLHEIAAYPICSSESNESSWLHDNNVTIRFSDTMFEPAKHDHLDLDSAILRLYKVNPNGTSGPNSPESEGASKAKRCVEPFLDSQIRVTVSIVQQIRRNNKQRKKRICNTMMMNVSKTGWVEIDIKRAIYIWEHVERQHQHQQQQQQQQQPAQHPRQPILVGWLMIEVHDEEERPLKPGLYFNPPKCDQADLAIPWNYYRPHTIRSPYAAVEVPRYPRLDVKLIGYASFVPKNYNKQLHQKLRENLRRQLYNLSKNSAEVDEEATTSIAPTVDNMLEPSVSTEIQHNHRKRHSHHYHHVTSQQPHSHQSQEELNTEDNNHEQPSSPVVVTTENEELEVQHPRAHHRHRRQHLHHNNQQQQQHELADDC